MAIDDALNRNPRKNSFGDAAAAMSNPNVTQVQTAPAQSAALKPAQPAGAQMTALPGAAPASLESRVSQIPTGGLKAPAPDGSQEQWRNTELGRNANNAMMALPGIGGLGRIAATGGAISTGLNAASTGINAASRMAAFGAGVAASGPATPAAASAPASNPYASVTPEQGRAMAEINAKAQSPMAVMPAEAQQPTGGGITRIDRPGHSPLYTDNKDPQMVGFLGRPAGSPTKEVSSIMQRMSDQSQNEAFGRFQKEANAAQYTREVQQAQAANAAGGENARNVQNRMDQEKYLRTLDAKGSSKAYHAALAQDAGFRAGADAGSVARTQNEGSSARERMQQIGATERALMQEAGQNSRFGQTQGVAFSKLAMEQEAQGFSSRAAPQRSRSNCATRSCRSRTRQNASLLFSGCGKCRGRRSHQSGACRSRLQPRALTDQPAWALSCATTKLRGRLRWCNRLGGQPQLIWTLAIRPR